MIARTLRSAGAAARATLFLSTVAMFLAGAALAQNAWHVGDKVRVWVSADYYNGTVIGIGAGDNAGQYLIKFDNYAGNQYALAKNVLPRTTAAAPKSSGKVGSNGCRIQVLNGMPFCDPGTVKR